MPAVLGLVIFLGAMSGVHEMQTAEGIGLYFSTIAGGDRGFFDVLTDLLAGLVLLLLVIVPCVLMGHGKLPAVFRFLTGFLAFMPSLSISYLIHLFDEGGRGGSPDFLLKTLGLEVPFAFFLLMGVGCFESAWKKWYGITGAAAAVLGLCSIWETELFGFLLVYAVLLICFDAWERLIRLCPRLEIYGWILFGGLWLRAVYRILLLKSLY